MIENDEVRQAVAVDKKQEPDRAPPAWSWAALCCIAGFLACLALMIAPDDRLIGSKLMASLPTSRFLVFLGSWLPPNFHWLPNAKDSFTSTNNIEFLFFIALAFIFYGVALLLILRLPASANFARVQALMWTAVVLAGAMLICTPFLLSHDLFVYADYGHTLLTYHTNLYFTPPLAISHSSITQLDDWTFSVAAYGPLWLGFSTLVALPGGDHPLRYILGFRVLGLLAHIVNIWLVMRILRESGRAPRTVMLGTLLYALNPLTLIESALGAHNDTEMITFLLLGTLLCLRAERRGFIHITDYALPAIAFSLAILIKFTSLPVLIFYLALLARKSWPATAAAYTGRYFSDGANEAEGTKGTRKGPEVRLSWQRWPADLLKPVTAGLLSAGIVLLCYAPFWIGHSPSAILKSFNAPPSARLAENSILRASEGWIHLHGLPPSSSWTHTLLLLMANHTTWNIASILAVLGGMIYGIILLWRRPATGTLTAASLLTLGALLIVTPWLFAWYVTWLIALAAVLLGQPMKGVPRDALVAFAIAFSVSIFFTYMGNDLPVFGNEGFAQCLRIFGIPLLTFLFALLSGRVLSLSRPYR